MDRELKINHSNDLTEAAYKLTLNESRLVFLAMAKIDTKSTVERFSQKAMRIDAREYAETYGVALSHAYEALQDGSDKLYERDIRTYDKKGRVSQRMRFVGHVKYHEGEGWVELGWYHLIVPHLYLLGQRFTSYELRQVTRLGSPYSFRLYELLKQWATTGERYISVEKFKQRLGLESLYPRFFDLKRRVIEPAVKELNLHTDLDIDWDVQKKGRQVVSLIFIFDQKIQQTLDL